MLAYISFDVVPAPKGASTHILAFSRTLAQAFGRVDLVTVSSSTEPTLTVERWPGIWHTELPAVGASLIDRVLCFRRFLRTWIAPRNYEAIQFRSIFEGIELVGRRRAASLIYEVNGLHSIELKYHYPGVEDDSDLLRKLVAQEKMCLQAAGLIITPSAITRNFLQAFNSTIQVIPNGVDLSVFKPSVKTRTESLQLLYFGTLASWQGVELAVRALAKVRSELPATLTIVGAASSKQRDSLLSLARKLGVDSSCVILPAVTQTELVTYLHNSDVVLVPLPWNDRNVIQGCCPLKILEAMAAGVPVVTSDLPVTRELGVDQEHFLLVKPGSVDQIAQAVLRIAREPGWAEQLAKAARTRVEQHYTWERAGALLVAAYEALGIKRPSTI